MMFKFVKSILIVFVFAISLFGQDGKGSEAEWNVTLKEGITAKSTITLVNRCFKSHKFNIRPENVPFLRIPDDNFKVGGSKTRDVPVTFDTTNTGPGDYEGKVIVICIDCKKEPGCTQDRETLRVLFKVPGQPVAADAENKSEDDRKNAAPANSANTTTISSNPQDPCEKIMKRCDDLLKIANAKKAISDSKQSAADALRITADRLETEAANAEAKATLAETMATFPPPSGRGSVDGGQEYTTADSAYLEQMNAAALAEYQAGDLTAAEYEQRLKDNNIEKARLERIKNEKRLKEEAKEARRKATEARTAANKAKADANKAQREADSAKAEADKARKAYEDCIEKAEDECKKIKKQIEDQRIAAEQARIAAEAQKKREEAAAAAEEERKRKADLAAAQAEELRKQQEQAAEARRQTQLAILREKFRQMYELGFISGSEIDENKVVLGFLGKFLQNPVENTVEEGLIPESALEVIRELVLVRNPCGDNIVKLAAWRKLETMINPVTKRQYTDAEAQRTLDEMCRILRTLGQRVDELKKYYEDS